MKKILLVSVFVFSFFAFGQKVKVKKDIATVDGKEYVKVVEDGASRYCYNILSLDGKDLLYLKLNEYKDSKEVDYKFNKDGSVVYYEVMSSDLNTIYFETFPTSCLVGCNPAENVVKMLYSSNVINVDGSVNLDKMEILSKKIGFEYSKKREEMSNTSSGSTVIIQNQTAPAPRKGINIGIGIGR